MTRVTRVRAAGYALCVVAALGCFVMNVMPPRDQISALEPTWSARGVCFDNTTDGCAEVSRGGHCLPVDCLCLAWFGGIFVSSSRLATPDLVCVCVCACVC